MTGQAEAISDLGAAPSRCQSCLEPSPKWAPAYPELGIFRCVSCESLSFRGAPAASELASLYDDQYFHGAEYFDYLGHIRVHERNFARKWELLRPYLPESVRLFEIGCCYGFFVAYALSRGAGQAFGVDVSEEAIRYATKHFGPYFAASPEVRFPSFEFNCVVAWDVWEHLDAPADYFSAVRERLAPGGIVALTTVDAGSFVARLRGRKWRQIHPPTHLHYPTRSALRTCFEKLGFEVLCQRSFGYYRALECYLLALHLPWVRKLPEVVRTFPLLVDLKDAQLLIARKK